MNVAVIAMWTLVAILAVVVGIAVLLMVYAIFIAFRYPLPKEE